MFYLMALRFGTNHGENAIARRGPILWNAMVRNIKDFGDESYKCLAKTLRSGDRFKELTFRETCRLQILEVQILASFKEIYVF